MKTEAEIRKMYWDWGLTSNLAAQALGISQTHFNRLMHRYAIPFRSMSVYKSHPLKIDISDEEVMAYITGLLLGDAWVARDMEVLLVSKDEPFARSAAKAFATIGLRPHVWCNPRRYWVMQVRSVLFARWWKRLDWEEKAKMASVVPAAFIRGLYESEGSLGLSHRNRGVFPVLQFVTSHHPTATLFNELSPVRWYHRHPSVAPNRKTLCRLAITQRALVDEFLRVTHPCIKNSYANPVPAGNRMFPGVRRDCTE